MKFNFTPFYIEFNSPIKFGKNLYPGKNGYVLELHSNNISGLGELSPFIDLHGIEPDEAKFELIEFLNNIEKLDFESFDLTKSFFDVLKYKNSPIELSSASTFCLEMALMDLALKENKVNENSLTSKSSITSYNGLLIPNDQIDLDSQLSFLKETKLGSLKVKIGRLSPGFENVFLKEIIKLKPEIKLRLDGNLNLDLEQLIALLEDIPFTNIEYLEEPLKNLNNYNLDYDYALDENLSEYKKKFPKASHWILKPAIQGGLVKTLEIIKEANKRNTKVVISSSFESSLGLRYLILLANYQNSFSKTDCGLDTLKYLKNDPGFNKITFSDGNITLKI